MIVYTLTANVDEDIATDWLLWMKHEILQFVHDTNLLVEYKLFKVLNDKEGVTFTFQLFFQDETAYQSFIQYHHAEFASKINERYTDKAVYFNTLLQQL
ncbi:MAG: DUF4286 family protein [Chitinophagales bacterium]|nr:DUF4286 family protein [Bacteroidota bacterium]